MKIGIISDGKFGDRSNDVIRDKFPVEWIMVPFPGSPVVDDIELSIPAREEGRRSGSIPLTVMCGARSSIGLMKISARRDPDER